MTGAQLLRGERSSLAGGPLERTASRLSRRLDALPANLNALAVAIVLGAAIAFLVSLGIVDYWVRPTAAFWLDNEGNPPAIFSALLLAGASLLALLEAHRHPLASRERRVYAGLAAGFAFMSLDEFRPVHEHINDKLGIPWQALYAPLIAVLAVLAYRAWKDLGPRSTSGRMWIAGGASWFVAQLLDLYQTTLLDNDTALNVYKITVVIEEGLEMLGSSLFLIALLLALQRQARRGPALKRKSPGRRRGSRETLVREGA